MLSIGKLAIQLTTPLLLHKPRKRFASVARVCQRQLAFLVTNVLQTFYFTCNHLLSLTYAQHAKTFANMFCNIFANFLA